MSTEADRIEAMRAAGTISDAEAERLLAVLADLGAVPPAVGPVAPAPAPAGPATPARPAAPAGAHRPAPDPHPQPEGGAAARPAGDREAWRALKEQLREAAREAKEAAREAVREARSSEVARDAKDAAREVADKVRAGVEQLRVSLGGAAAAGGAGDAPADGAPAGAAVEPPAGPAAIAPEGTRWLAVDVPAGDVELIAADVAAPELDPADTDAAVRLEPNDAGARVWLDGERSVWGRLKPVDVRVRVPRAWGVDLDVKAGDLDVRGVAYVRGRVLAGDVQVREAQGLDLECLAGDLSVSLRPTAGSHRLTARAGDVSVRFLPGSDATVSARVAMGEASARGLTRERRGLGAVVSGRLGSGAARVAIELGAGDLEVRAEGSEG